MTNEWVDEHTMKVEFDKAARVATIGSELKKRRVSPRHPAAKSSLCTGGYKRAVFYFFAGSDRPGRESQDGHRGRDLSGPL